MFNSCQLFGQNRVELNTELRFLIASAKVDGAELLRIDPPTCEDEKENLRIIGCIIKVLRTLKKEGVIEFYVNRQGAQETWRNRQRARKPAQLRRAAVLWRRRLCPGSAQAHAL